MNIRHKKSLEKSSGGLRNVFLSYCAVPEIITPLFLMAPAMGREDRGLLLLRL